MSGTIRTYSPDRHPNGPLRLLWATILLPVCSMAGFSLTLGIGIVFFHATFEDSTARSGNSVPEYASSPIGTSAAQIPLSTVFSAEVLYWTPLIKAWAAIYQIDPNLIATLVQIESCGDPLVSSPAGAQGLFQVMPFHFAPEEDMLDVNTNARRGLDYLRTSLKIADGHAGLALAGYNGGHGVIAKGWAAWSSETRRYYYWGSRIYAEAVAGLSASPTLEEWKAGGGSRLCVQARQTQHRLEQEKQVSVPPSTLN